MNFELTDEQKDIMKAAREFAQGEFDPDLALELDQTGQFPEAIWKKACQLGFIGLHYPEEFGGQGLGLFDALLVIENFCRVDSGIGCALSSVDLGSEAILRFGSQEQKKRFLPPLVKGERLMTVAFAETEDDRDLSSISTTAARSGDEYLLNGRKRFVPNGLLADVFLILGNEPEKGWVTLIVERGREKDGIEVEPVEKMGLKMVSFGDLHLKGLRVPYGSRLGNGNEGFLHVGHCYQAIGLRGLARAVGVAQGSLERAILHAKQREQFGRKLSQFQVIRHKLADMAVGIETSRCLIYKRAAEYDQGRADSGLLSMAQLEVGRRMISIVDEAVQILGGYGYMAEQAIEHYFRDAWAIAVELGTEEELKDVIADGLLGPLDKK
jgi:alkylation response protein AidB-like acyl-CoA dehydrogenase